MRRTGAIVVVCAAALGLAVAAAAQADVSNLTRPTITGSGAFGTVLVCHPGTWSGATKVTDGFTDSSVFAPPFATGLTWKVAGPEINVRVHCIETATDSKGNQFPVLSTNMIETKPGKSHVHVSKLSTSHGFVTIKGSDGPAAALKGGRGQHAQLTVTRLSGTQYFSRMFTVRRTSFSLRFQEAPGRFKYEVTFSPAAGSSYDPSSTKTHAIAVASS